MKKSNPCGSEAFGALHCAVMAQVSTNGTNDLCGSIRHHDISIDSIYLCGINAFKLKMNCMVDVS